LASYGLNGGAGKTASAKATRRLDASTAKESLAAGGLDTLVEFGLLGEQNALAKAGCVRDLSFEVHVGGHDVTRADVAKVG